MARIVIIGGNGHVGTYLVPEAVERGHAVINVSRGTASPYKQHPAWKAIEQVVVDRKAEEAEGKFGSRIAGLNADIVVDMISFELGRTQQLVEALRGNIEHYLFCSSIWVYGHATSVPSTETDCTNAIDTYGINRQRSRLGFCSRLGETVFLRHASGPATSLVRVGCRSILKPIGIPMFSR